MSRKSEMAGCLIFFKMLIVYCVLYFDQTRDTKRNLLLLITLYSCTGYILHSYAVLKSNAVNFYIDKYPKVLPFCEITPSKSHGNYWQKIS